MTPDEIPASKKSIRKILIPFSGLPNGEWKIRMEVLVYALVLLHAAELMTLLGV